MKYLERVAQRLDEEMHRVQSYLHSSTLPTLIKKMEEVLIHDQLDVIYTEAKILLRDERHQGKTFHRTCNHDSFPSRFDPAV